MTQPSIAPPVPPVETPKSTTRRGIKIVLALSLAVNLAIAGVIFGGMMKGGFRGHGAEMGRDLGFGVFAQALRPEDRKALRRALIARAPELRDAAMNAQQDVQALLVALRNVPFDPVQMQTAMDAQQERLSTQLLIGKEVLVAYLAALNDQERSLFAQRLAAELDAPRGGGKDKDRKE
jgi:uncharacterized membrane protein